MFPERTHSASSLSAAAAESWSALTLPSSLRNMNRAMKNFFTTVVSHKHRNEAFIHLLLIFERLGVQNTED